MLNRLKQHWPEYLMEAAELAAFMVSACAFSLLLEHPASPVRSAIHDNQLRRVLMGVAMGLTAIAIIYSPWGQQSGAHFNPAVTLTFWRLGKVQNTDACFYILAQFIGGLFGVALMAAILPTALSHPAVNYVATLPGKFGVSVAFAAELSISFLLMSVVLRVSNTTRLARYTGLFSGALVATYISLEAPISGMSMNPARTFGSALSAQLWTALWLYFTAPPLGMLAAAQVYLWQKQPVACAKLHHQNDKRCIHCGASGAMDIAASKQQLKEKEGESMKRAFFLGLVTLVALFTATAQAQHQGKGEIKFTVRIENVSNPDGQVAQNGSKWPFALSPGLFVLHERDVRLFREGNPAINGLEAQAEDGNPGELVKVLENRQHMGHGIFNTPVGADKPGPIGPGAAYEFSFTAKPGMRLSVITMFGQSNDWFYAPQRQGIDLFVNGKPLSGDITTDFMLFDAGTEANEEPGVGSNQAPRQAAPNTGPAEHGKVHAAKESTFFSKTGQLFKVTITPDTLAKM